MNPTACNPRQVFTPWHGQYRAFIRASTPAPPNLGGRTRNRG